MGIVIGAILRLSKSFFTLSRFLLITFFCPLAIVITGCKKARFRAYVKGLMGGIDTIAINEAEYRAESGVPFSTDIPAGYCFVGSRHVIGMIFDRRDDNLLILNQTMDAIFRDVLFRLLVN